MMVLGMSDAISAAWTSGRNHCCLHSSGLTLSPPPRPFAARRLGAGASESESYWIMSKLNRGQEKAAHIIEILLVFIVKVLEIVVILFHEVVCERLAGEVVDSMGDDLDAIRRVGGRERIDVPFP